jgi:hypothetical protein
MAIMERAMSFFTPFYRTMEPGGSAGTDAAGEIAALRAEVAALRAQLAEKSK